MGSSYLTCLAEAIAVVVLAHCEACLTREARDYRSNHVDNPAVASWQRWLAGCPDAVDEGVHEAVVVGPILIRPDGVASPVDGAGDRFEILGP